MDKSDKGKVLELQRRFQEYQLPLETIEFENKEEIAIIFERVNRAGIQLDAFQLLSAWTWSSEFDLNDAMSELESELSSFGFSELAGDPNLIMKCCSAVVVGDAQLKNVVNLHGPTVRDEFEKIRRGIRGAIDFLRSNFEIENLKLMPYPAMIVPLAAFFATDRKSGIQPSEAERQQLVRWYWRSCVSRRYSSGVGRAHSADISYVSSLRADSSVQPLKSTRSLESSFFIENKFSISNVNSKILVNILSHRGPISFLSGSPVDVRKVLQLANRNEFHHIFPKAYLKRHGVSDAKINSLANICFLSKSDNIKIKDSPPSVYSKLSSKDRYDEILCSNLIPKKFGEMKFDEFLFERAKMLSDYANSIADIDLSDHTISEMIMRFIDHDFGNFSKNLIIVDPESGA